MPSLREERSAKIATITAGHTTVAGNIVLALALLCADPIPKQQNCPATSLAVKAWMYWKGLRAALRLSVLSTGQGDSSPQEMLRMAGVRGGGGTVII